MQGRRPSKTLKPKPTLTGTEGGDGSFDFGDLGWKGFRRPETQSWVQQVWGGDVAFFVGGDELSFGGVGWGEGLRVWA